MYVYIWFIYFFKYWQLLVNISSLIILALNGLLLDYFHVLPKTLNVGDVPLSFNAIIYENVEYVVISFQNTLIEVF